MNETRPMIFHDVNLGASRLLRQPSDLSGSDGPEQGLDPTPREYRELFLKYTLELEWATGTAIHWWNSLVVRSMQDGLTEVDAIRTQYENRPAGPASRPEVIFVIRRYWLQIVLLNKKYPESRRVAPQSFLLTWLSESGLSDLYDILTGMPYWPIGFDENGNWC
ncbi:MAG: hypothetical protein E5Y31_06935 [Mesorhizobium sp.]|nr:MAG: hypothetical protein E5Y31_06935 [Mesorhizobium sp.]